MADLRLYWQYLKILLKSQLQYRLSFCLLTVAQFIIPFSFFAAVYFLFARFGSLQGWDFYETALGFAVINLAFACSQCFTRGFDSFAKMVNSGDFDRLLLRPRSTLLQVAASKFEFIKSGRVLQGIVVLGWALSGLTIKWNCAKILLLLLMLCSGICLFSGIFLVAAAMCFWTVSGLDVVDLLANGGREMAQYPQNIYKRWLTWFFTFVIPFACVNYLPLLYLLDKGTEAAIVYYLSPLGGVIFLLPCLCFWRLGVSRYLSTGS